MSILTAIWAASDDLDIRCPTTCRLRSRTGLLGQSPVPQRCIPLISQGIVQLTRSKHGCGQGQQAKDKGICSRFRLGDCEKAAIDSKRTQARGCAPHDYPHHSHSIELAWMFQNWHSGSVFSNMLKPRECSCILKPTKQKPTI